MKTQMRIPAAIFAADDAELAKKREELKKKLLSGSINHKNNKIIIGKNGNIVDQSGEKEGLSIPIAKLADDAELAKKREELKKRLLTGNKKIIIGKNGNIVDQNGKKDGLSIPEAVLALEQWYEKDPILLQAEKAAMGKFFPDFVLDKLEDGRLYWTGTLNLGVIGENEWTIMAVYDNNHPRQIMGSSVKVYLVEPDIDELIESLGWRPYHLLRDSNNQSYLCTTEAESVKTGKESTSAASVIAWAIKWLAAFELVLTGDLTMEQFNTHGVI